MSYIKKTLTSGEKLIILKRRHWFFWIKPSLWSVGLMVAFYVYTSAYAPPQGIWETTQFILIITGLVLLPLWLWNWMKYRSKEYAVTTKRVIVKKGIIRVDTDELRNERIENIQIKLSLLGRLFGYGDLEFKGTGGTEVVFFFIADPVGAKKTIEAVIFARPLVTRRWQAQTSRPNKF